MAKMKLSLSVFVLTTSLAMDLKNEHMRMLAMWCAVISGFVIANLLRREYPVAADVSCKQLGAIGALKWLEKNLRTSSSVISFCHLWPKKKSTSAEKISDQR